MAADARVVKEHVLRQWSDSELVAVSLLNEDGTHSMRIYARPR